jgi:hypothetical protein
LIYWKKKHLPKVKGSGKIDLGKVHVDPKNAPMKDIECPIASIRYRRQEPAPHQISKPVTALFSMPLQPKA